MRRIYLIFVVGLLWGCGSKKSNDEGDLSSVVKEFLYTCSELGVRSALPLCTDESQFSVRRAMALDQFLGLKYLHCDSIRKNDDVAISYFKCLFKGDTCRAELQLILDGFWKIHFEPNFVKKNENLGIKKDTLLPEEVASIPEGLLADRFFGFCVFIDLPNFVVGHMPYRIFEAESSNVYEDFEEVGLYHQDVILGDFIHVKSTYKFDFSVLSKFEFKIGKLRNDIVDKSLAVMLPIDADKINYSYYQMVDYYAIFIQKMVKVFGFPDGIHENEQLHRYRVLSWYLKGFNQKMVIKFDDAVIHGVMVAIK